MADVRDSRKSPPPTSGSAGTSPLATTPEGLVLAWAPWVGTAAAAGVYVGGGLDTVFGLEPGRISLLVLAAATAGWLALDTTLPRADAVLLFGGGGAVLLSALLGYALAGSRLSSVGWLVLATLLAVGFAAAADRLLGRTGLSASARSLSTFVVFAQALDGTTTAVGIDVLGYGEQSRLSAAILDAAAGLPGSAVVGAGWLFVLVKVLLALAAVAVLLGGTADRLRTVALAVAAFVGLGPAVHNLVLFTV